LASTPSGKTSKNRRTRGRVVSGRSIPDFTTMPWQVTVVVLCFASGIYLFVYATEGWTPRSERRGGRPRDFDRGRAYALLHASVFAFGSWVAHGLTTLLAPDQDWPYIALGVAAGASLAMQASRAWFVWRQRAEDGNLPARPDDDGLAPQLATVGYALLAVSLLALGAVFAAGGGQGRPGASIGQTVRQEARTSDLGSYDVAGTVAAGSKPPPSPPHMLPENATWLKVDVTWQGVGPLVPPDVVIEVQTNGTWQPTDHFSAGTAYDWQNLSWAGTSIRFSVEPQAGTIPGDYVVHVHVLAHEVRDCTTRSINGAPDAEVCGRWRGAYAT